MHRESSQYPTLRDLAYEIGQVQIFWCFLEAEMRRHLENTATDNSAKGTIMTRWRRLMGANVSQDQVAEIPFKDALEAVARTRNLLAHGITSANADPWEKDSAYVVCEGADGVKHTLTIETLRDLSADIERLTLSLRRFCKTPR